MGGLDDGTSDGTRPVKIPCDEKTCRLGGEGLKVSNGLTVVSQPARASALTAPRRNGSLGTSRGRASGFFWSSPARIPPSHRNPNPTLTPNPLPLPGWRGSRLGVRARVGARLRVGELFCERSRPASVWPRSAAFRPLQAPIGHGSPPPGPVAIRPLKRPEGRAPRREATNDVTVRVVAPSIPLFIALPRCALPGRLLSRRPQWPRHHRARRGRGHRCPVAPAIPTF